jgi:hypothetical protein
VSKRRIKLNEDDLKAFLTTALRDAGFMTAESEILGFEYTTKTIKKGGDFYKDGVDDPEYKGEVEVVKFVKVLTETKHRRSSEDASTDDEGSESPEDG